MAGMQISGLTGFNSADIVSQLMSVERQAGNSLIKAKSTSNTLVSALQSLNGLFSKMKDAATALAPSSVLDASAWKGTTATSNQTGIATATTTDKAQAGSLTFTVKSLAASGAAISGNSVDGAAVLNGGAAFDLTLTKGSGAATTVSVPAGAKMADVAAAINNTADLGVKATMVQVSPGQYKLQLESSTTGAGTDVTVADSTGGASGLGTFSTLRAGSDTVLRVGDSATGFDVTSPTTTVKDVLPGVTITAVKADPSTPVTVTVGADASGIADKAKAFVDSANEVLSSIRVNTKYDKDTKTAGTLNGDSTVRDLANRLQSVFVGVGSDKLAKMGVSFTKEGTLSFDKAKFAAAYAENPAAVEAAFTDTATKVRDLGKQASNATDGLLTVRINGEQALVKDYTKRISDFNDRMSLKQETLKRQFSALETMLSKMQQQGNWLSGQLQSLSSQSGK
ncbi:flagellar hook-associated protein 2 [Austwickia chelonae]|uniref:Flagellar hook-associated protein 2 n=1 Tax=Austwickia chelonae NBRC 105200 TaxID=1184607 RepID=K6VVU5_9MICO|nr:flagellar filament capping protein FliD [Austwickia chelonae]GAB79460.1 flagellar hook-associated protein 2 [Austwickia chelonae NBRC 105200]SEV88228.1 flagellar hook-associated protein 2 [Austwickia chelonae]